jgi:hypothetical protein
VAAVLLVAAVALAASLRGLAPASAGSSPSRTTEASATPGPTGTGTPVPATPTAAPPSQTPEPPVTLVPDPLTGLPVTVEASQYHPVAVMVDDHVGARPQSGFNAAAVVWQAPAEGGIPRYMMVFQGTIPEAVGPIRSARQYYVEWASEYNAMYMHVGGSPQAMATLKTYGRGQLVWNADEFRWGPKYMWRVTTRVAPHNVYTDGEHMRDLEDVIGIPDKPIKPAWQFTPYAPAHLFIGIRISVVYPYESVTFAYQPEINAYYRYLAGSKTPQVDAADGEIVAPKNVVVLRMHFGALANSNPAKHRLEAGDVGHGDAWISTGGVTIHGTWRKASVSAPTLLFDAKGRPVTLTAGQTFVEVIALTYSYKIVQGTPAPAPVPEGDRRFY